MSAQLLKCGEKTSCDECFSVFYVVRKLRSYVKVLYTNANTQISDDTFDRSVLHSQTSQKSAILTRAKTEESARLTPRADISANARQVTEAWHARRTAHVRQRLGYRGHF